jgi:hypothetical protein
MTPQVFQIVQACFLTKQFGECKSADIIAQKMLKVNHYTQQQVIDHYRRTLHKLMENFDLHTTAKQSSK